MSTSLAPVTKLKGFMANIEVKSRLNDMLGQKAPAFMSSIVQVVSGSNALQKCDPASIMSAAFIAASFDLPIDQNLGFAAIVPYKGKAQFQMMYRGFIQLAIRTSQYKGMNASEVYEDELIKYNPITKEAEFKIINGGFRDEGNVEKIVGYYAWFELINGFKQSIYMSVDEISNHAKKYSQSYGYDLRENKKSSKWSTDFDAMAIKTVIKQLLSKWGILSTDMQRAITEDQKVYINHDDGKYLDNPETAQKQIENPFDKEKDSANHINTINKIVVALETDQPILDEFLVEFEVDKIEEITVGQAQKIITELSKKLDDKQ